MLCSLKEPYSCAYTIRTADRHYLPSEKPCIDAQGKSSRSKWRVTRPKKLNEKEFVVMPRGQLVVDELLLWMKALTLGSICPSFSESEK